MNEKELLAIVKDRYEYRNGDLLVKWRFNSRVKVGDKAGSYLTDGYRQLRICGKQYREHHIVWLLHNDYLPKELDHINCIRDDNRIENLRECTRNENMQNRKIATKRSKSGVLGVTEVSGRFAACIRRDGVRKHLGTFDTPDEAGMAYIAAKTAYEERKEL